MDEELQRGLMTAVGMSIAYLASGLGMLFAYLGYQKRHSSRPQQPPGSTSEDR